LRIKWKWIDCGNDGRVMRLVFLPLIRGGRKELVESIKKIGKESSVVIRVIVRDVGGVLKAEKEVIEIVEDGLEIGETGVKKLIGGYIARIDGLVLIGVLCLNFLYRGE